MNDMILNSIKGTNATRIPTLEHYAASQTSKIFAFEALGPENAILNEARRYDGFPPK